MKKETDRWIGRIGDLQYYGDYYEMVIESRSRIHVLFGKTMMGGFACMPDFGVGCYLGKLEDANWNEKELVHILGVIDGLTVSEALKSLIGKIDF